MDTEIPSEGRIPLLDITIPLHWDNHALVMFFAWFVLVPFAVMFLRFGKIAPRLYGIPRGTPKWGWPELCWTLHFYLLYGAIILAVAAALFAIVLTGGISGSLHSWFGIGAVTLGAFQIVSSWLRGSHGGRKAASSDPEDRSTWGGDHFDMTPQRWWFEAYHKTAGYFAIVLALGAVATGLSQYWLPGVAIGLAVVFVVALVLSVLLQGLGCNHDTYQSVYGYHPDNPFNRRRYDAMMKAQGEKP